jgi:hypothetical protein
MKHSRTSRTQHQDATFTTPLTQILVVKFSTLTLFRCNEVRGKCGECFPISTSETFFVNRESINHHRTLCTTTFRQVFPFYVTSVVYRLLPSAISLFDRVKVLPSKMSVRMCSRSLSNSASIDSTCSSVIASISSLLA